MSISGAKIQRSSPISEQIRDILRDRIENQAYGKNGRFPSEERLSAEFNASRATVRTALSLLIAEGLLFRNRGIGTFVATHNDRLVGGLERLESVLTMAKRQNLKTRVADLAVETIKATAPLSEHLHIPHGAAVLSVRRTILVDAKAVCYLEDFIACEWLDARAVDATFTGSVLDLLVQKYPGIRTALAEVTAVGASQHLSELLHVPLRSPLILLNEHVFNEDGRVVAYSDNYFVPGKFRLSVVRR